jgi:hypothetical protein
MIATGYWRAALFVAAGLGVGTVAAAQEAGRPECPHDWDVKGGQVPEVQPIMNIPEYHDCQRFIVRVEGGGVRYDSLYAIFATAALDVLERSLEGTARCAACLAPGGRGSPPPQQAEEWRPLREHATTLGVVAARIYAEGDYAPLGMARFYNCLYLFRAGDAWGAIMVPVRDANSTCLRPIDPAIPWGTELQVLPPRVSDSVPAVARWDFDTTHVWQYVGIKCGDAWCEVGPPGFEPSPLPELEEDARQLLGVRGRIKGWYDEQYLAFLDNETHTRPSVVRGRIFPARGLDSLRDVDTVMTAAETGAFRFWTNAAWIVLDTLPAGWARTPGLSLTAITALANADPLQQYKARLNLDPRPVATAPVSPAHMNLLQLCHGFKRECEIGLADQGPLMNCDGQGDWWAKVTGTAGEQKYMCVTRRGHMNLRGRFAIPGTARWRWMASDEGVWNACGQGCCETLGLGG